MGPGKLTGLAGQDPKDMCIFVAMSQPLEADDGLASAGDLVFPELSQAGLGLLKPWQQVGTFALLLSEQCVVEVAPGDGLVAFPTCFIPSMEETGICKTGSPLMQAAEPTWPFEQLW